MESVIEFLFSSVYDVGSDSRLVGRDSGEYRSKTVLGPVDQFPPATLRQCTLSSSLIFAI